MGKQQRYTPEFKAEAVKLVLEQGIQQSLATSRLGIPEGTLATWVAAAKQATSAASVPGVSGHETARDSGHLWVIA